MATTIDCLGPYCWCGSPAVVLHCPEFGRPQGLCKDHMAVYEVRLVRPAELAPHVPLKHPVASDKVF